MHRTPEDPALERALAAWRHALATETLYEVEFRIRRHDGAYRWFLARALPMRDADGVLMLLLGQDAVEFNRAFAAAGLDGAAGEGAPCLDRQAPRPGVQKSPSRHRPPGPQGQRNRPRPRQLRQE